MSERGRRLLDVVLLQGGWLACVAGAARGLPWLGPAVAAAGVAVHLRFASQRRRDLRVMAALLLLGPLTDVAQTVSGQVAFTSSGPSLGPLPLWLVALWPLFGVTFANLFGWLRGRWTLAALLGAAGGPPGYLAAERLGALALPEGAGVAWAGLAPAWALALVVGVAAMAGPARAAPRDTGPFFVVPPREVAREAVDRVVDPRWCLPEQPRGSGPPDLLARLVEILAWEAPSTDDAPPGGRRFRSLGDLVAAAGRTGDPAERRVLLASFAEVDPALWRRSGDLVTGLVTDHGLHASDWSPDQGRDDDGIVESEPLDLDDFDGEPWRSLSGSRDLHQAAVLVHADLPTIKAVENDYASYPEAPGSRYVSIEPVAGSHRRWTPRAEDGTTADGPSEGGPRVALEVEFVVDLPFPFTASTCRLGVLNRIDAAGRLVTDVVSTSDDFHWLAGRDVFLPVRTSAGAPAGTVIVRWFGFDLRGVPDGTGARREGLRAGLGRLKSGAEVLQRERGPLESIPEGTIPPFVVRGDERWRR